MKKKKQCMEIELACSRCGKTPAKWDAALSEYVCRDCRTKEEVENYKIAQENNGTLF